MTSVSIEPESMSTRGNQLPQRLMVARSSAKVDFEVEENEQNISEKQRPLVLGA